MEVTAIEPRRHRLSALFLNGEHAADVDTETLLRAGIKPGGDLTDEDLHELLLESDRRRAGEKALYLLEHRSYSQKELEDKVARTAGRGAAQEAAQRMADLGLVDDERYARDCAAMLLGRKCFSPRRAERELLQKGIDRELAEQIVQELSPDPEEQIWELLAGKYAAALNDEKGRRRAVAALQRLGWGWEDIRPALRRWDEENEE